MAKRYFWLKLPEDFFRQKPIKKLRKIAGGDTYTIIYLKMLLIAIKQDGRLFFDGVEDEFYDELALELDEDSENVKVTVMFLVKQGLIELVDESEYLLTKCSEMVGSEGSSAARMRQHRKKQTSLCDKGVTPSDNLVTERREEIEKEKDKETDNTICLELISSKQEGQQVFIQLPLVTGSGSFDVTFDYLNSLRILYPGIDVEQEFRKMYGWLDSNPRNRKTARGIKRFINGWLSRAQDKAPVVRQPTLYAQQPKNMTTEQYMQSTADWFEGLGDMNDTTGI